MSIPITIQTAFGAAYLEDTNPSAASQIIVIMLSQD
jgi:hypothetical protein